MSKIGRMPIPCDGVELTIQGNEVHYKGPHAQGVYSLPDDLTVVQRDNEVVLKPAVEHRDTNRIWGLHRALLANTLIGAAKLFQRQVQIVGLGYKVAQKGDGLQFSLGYSHKIDFSVPEGVTYEIDKTGQLLTLKSADKALLGQVASKVKALRPVEPYKGTGIHYVGERIRRKEGKTK